MPLTHSRSARAQENRSPDGDKLPFMMRGTPAAENDRLQRRANNLERQLFRQRVEDPDRLFNELRFALRREGFVRVRAEWLNCHFTFRAELGRKMKARLHGLKVSRPEDVLYGAVTRAARRCDLDPRIEDIGVSRRGNQVEGSISPVPFIVVTKALDKMLDRWASPRRDRCEANALAPVVRPAKRRR